MARGLSSCFHVGIGSPLGMLACVVSVCFCGSQAELDPRFPYYHTTDDIMSVFRRLGAEDSPARGRVSFEEVRTSATFQA